MSHVISHMMSHLMSRLMSHMISVIVLCDLQTHHDQKLFHQVEDAEAEEAKGRSHLQTSDYNMIIVANVAI